MNEKSKKPGRASRTVAKAGSAKSRSRTATGRGAAGALEGRKQAGEPLQEQESEARFRSTMDSMLEGCQIIDRSWRYVYINNAAERHNRRPKEELLGKRYMDMWPGIEATRVFAVIKRCLEERKAETIENKFVFPDGTIGWFELSIQPVPEGVFILSMDITTRKQAEEALRESEERFKAIVSSTPDHILVQDHDLRYAFVVNPQLGLTENDMLGKTDYDFLSKDDAEKLTRVKRQVLETGNPVRVEIPLVSPSAEPEFFSGSYVPKYDARGNIDGLIGYFQNCTDLKRTEEKLHHINRILRALSDSSLAMIRARTENDYLQQVCRIIVEDCGHAMVWIGFKEQDEAKSVRPVASAGFEEGYLETLHITWADSERGRGPTGTALRTGKPARCLNMLTDPQFAPWREQAIKRGYASSIVLPLMDGEQAFATITIYARDPDAFSEDEEKLLTELADDLAFGIRAIRTSAANLLAGAALRQSEERYHALIENAPLGIGMATLNGETLAANAALLRLLGYDQADFQQLNLRDIYRNPADRTRIVQRLQSEGRVLEEKVELNRKDGMKILVNLTAAKFAWENGEALLAIVEDVSERERLENIRDWLASFPELNPAPIVEMDFSGNVHYLNPAARKLFPDLEAKGKEHPWLSNLEPIFDGFQRGATTSAVRDVHMGELTYQQGIHCLSGKGRVRIYAVDITTRERAEEDMRRTRDQLEMRVRERTRELKKTNEQLQGEIAERQRLAQNLHDAVNQSLFSAGLIAEVLPRLWDRDQEAARRSLETLRRLTRGAQAELRALLAELRPDVLVETDLGDLLRQLTTAFTGRTSIQVALTMTGDAKLPPDVQVALYRLCQEGLNNVAKHARASRVEIALLKKSGSAELHLCDNGRGFDPDSPTPAGHLGLRGMRERAETAGLTLKISSRIGRGTEIAIFWEEIREKEKINR